MPTSTATPNTSETCLQSFPPVVAEHTRLLILGSLPGNASLRAGQYYAFRHNQFWRLMSDVLGCDLVALDYPTRLRSLLERGIGLWDVVATAQRSGSLDSQIRTPAGNDLPGLIATLPQLQAIAFNGGTAARLGMKVLAASASRYRLFHLPSSSPAYTLAYAHKLAAWQALLDALPPHG